MEHEEVGLGSWGGSLWAFKMLSIRNQSYEGVRRGHRPVADELRQSSVSRGQSNPP